MFSTIKKSLPKEKTVHGCVVKRMPLGAYLKALQTLQDFPRDIAAQLLPVNGDIGKALEQLKHIDRSMMIDLLLKALAIVPERVIALVSELTDIPLERLLKDPDVGMDGFAEIIDMWLEVNGAENFLRAASHAGKTMKTLAATLKAGSKS